MNARPAPARAQGSRRVRRDLDDARIRAWRVAMETVTALVARFDEDFRAGAGIDATTYDALLHVFDAGPEGIRMTDLARSVVLTKPGLTSLVDRLEARGLVRRTPDPGDRRAVRVQLTAAGEQVFRTAARLHVAGLHERIGRHLSEDEARLVAEVFERIAAANP